MLKLTNIHIEEIRSFFLASNEEDMLTIQKNIRPSYLSNFLPQLRQLFNSKHLNETELVSIAKNMGAAEHLESLKEIKQDYYSRLANLFHSGITNGDIETLLSIQNIDFGAEVEFQKELKTAFQLNERAALKKKFQQLEKDYELSDNEISTAFILNERERLRNEFQKDDQTEALVRESILSISNASLKSTDYSFELNNRAIRKRNKWRVLSIAASVIGLIITTTLFITNYNERNDIANNNFKKNNADQQDSLKTQKTITNFNDAFNKTSEIVETRVLNEKTPGLANKEEILTIKKYYLEKGLIEIEKEITDEFQGRTGKAGTGPVAKLNQAKKDSIYNLINKYNFKQNNITIYLLSKTEIKVFKLSRDYYVLIDNTVYKCKKTTTLLPLTIVTDRTILHKINQLNTDNPD